MKKHTERVPQYNDLLIPTLEALLELGGSGTIREINNKVYEIENTSDEVLEILHGTTSEREIDYRLAWSRTYLRKYGLIENSARGIWSLLKTDLDIKRINPSEIVRAVRDQKANNLEQQDGNEQLNEIECEVELSENWKDKLLDILYHIPSSAFEILSGRILRESGVTDIEITGKSGDGGIDGKGIVKVRSLLSFPVVFQCKRYKGSVGSKEIRDLRGAMAGRADKGFMITTGHFTRDAYKEASREGTPTIDLIDGEALCELMKKLKLGVDVQLTEIVEIKTEWFERFEI